MRKNISGLLLVIAATVSAIACGENSGVPGSVGIETESTTDAEQYFQDGTLTYTNLVGEDVQNEVGEILRSAGISQEHVGEMFQWVDDFNQCMGKCETFHLVDGFLTENIAIVDYGEYYPMSTAWFKTNKRDYGDVLCRIAAFQLVQDHITVKNFLNEDLWEGYHDTQWLYSDYDAISSNPLIDFDKEQQNQYFTLFNPVVITPGCSEDEMFQSISEEWQKRGISFAEGKVSLITIWTQYENQTAAAHAAVLVQNGGSYLLVEKTNPQSPYQATMFSTISQVRQYMYESIHIEDVRYDMETGTYIVMENDRII